MGVKIEEETSKCISTESQGREPFMKEHRNQLPVSDQI